MADKMDKYKVFMVTARVVVVDTTDESDVAEFVKNALDATIVIKNEVVDSLIKTFNIEKCDEVVPKLRILQDQDCENPRIRDCNICHIVTWSSKYRIGDEQPRCTPEEWLADVVAGSVVFPVFMHDHSGITLSLSDFNDKWDSGQIGYAVVNEKTMKELLTAEERTPEKLKEFVDSELQAYNNWANGNCWGYVFTDEHGNEESCWGFIVGDDTKYFKESLPEDAKKLFDQAWKERE